MGSWLCIGARDCGLGGLGKFADWDDCAKLRIGGIGQDCGLGGLGKMVDWGDGAGGGIGRIGKRGGKG